MQPVMELQFGGIGENRNTPLPPELTLALSSDS